MTKLKYKEEALNKIESVFIKNGFVIDKDIDKLIWKIQ